VLETVYSLSDEVPPLGSAPADAGSSCLQAGSLLLGSIREICFLRKISGGGALLHTDIAIEPGERLELELLTGEHIDGIVAWRSGFDVGLRFEEPVDVFSILARNLVSQPGERRRMPRIELQCPALLETAARTDMVTTCDVAQGGVKLALGFALTADEPVTLTMEGFRPLEGEVRWAREQFAGIGFRPEIDWQELMPWLRARRETMLRGGWAPAPPAPPSSPAAPAPAAEGSVQLSLPARVREGLRRWNIEVAAIDTRTVEFECFVPLRLGTLLWIVLPGLEGWPARVAATDGYRFTCEFTQPLHPAVLERILASGKA
jgi:PilZ domain